ncbi:MAG: hypothetical protein K2K57_08665 [Oscillospiraceae bacterium]|nr:hypothetical protein [Oscillospiraceae bacterium]
MPINSNNSANIYTPTGAATARTVPDKAPDFGDFLTAAAEKQQDRLPENRPPEKIKRVYTMSPGQKKSLRKKYGSARFSGFEIIIDRDRIYCNNPILTEFTRKLWEMGMLTPEEAELGAGKRPLPRDVFTARKSDKNDRHGEDNGSALISAGNDYLYDNSGWIDLLYPRKIPESVGDYFAHQEIVLNTLRVYLSNPTAAISLWGEYFAFDPFQIKECLAAVQKISSLWADTAMKDKGALYSQKRTFYRERPTGENIGNIIDTKLPVRSTPEPYGNVPRSGARSEMPEQNTADFRRDVPGENISEKSVTPIGSDVQTVSDRNIPRENALQRNPEAQNKPYRNIPQKNGGNSPKSASQNRSVSSDNANSFEQISWDENDALGNSFEEIPWDDTPKSNGKNSGYNNTDTAAKTGAGSYNHAPRESAAPRNSQDASGHISQTPISRNTAGNSNTPYKNTLGRNYTAGTSVNAPKAGVNPYEKPSENSDAFREVSLDEAAGKESTASSAPSNNVPFKEIPRDPIVHRGAADRAKAYREIPGERSGRIEPTPEPYREPAPREKSGHSQNSGHSPKELLKTPRKEAPSGKQDKPAHKEAGTVAAYQEMFKERNARRKGEK